MVIVVTYGCSNAGSVPTTGFQRGVGDAQHPEPQDDPLQAGVQAAEHGSPYRGPVLDPRSLDGALHIEPN
jgi:hypothetical protein